MNLIGATVLLIFLFGQFAFTEHRKDPFIQWHVPNLPTKIDFAGEAVPLNRWDVKEKLDREVLINFYGQANILFLLKLSDRYFPVISERLKANEVPDDFKYLCVRKATCKVQHYPVRVQ